MTDDGTENTGQVATCEGDSKLCSFAIVLFSLGENVVVEELHESFKGHKLDDCVGYLSGPQRHESLVHSAYT